MVVFLSSTVCIGCGLVVVGERGGGGGVTCNKK